MRRIVTGSLAAVAALLSGCAAGIDPMPTADGRAGYNIECGGSAYTWAKCYKAAAKVCPAGFDVIDRDSSSTPTNFGPLVERNLIVACKRA
ncbi:hypothetical protein [Paraburkholderia hospita]|uniref:hypothetical protein n=2 Tax=Paraburkholderia hospita TaxID=169430 RepID=UPI003ECF9919